MEVISRSYAFGPNFSGHDMEFVDALLMPQPFSSVQNFLLQRGGEWKDSRIVEKTALRIGSIIHDAEMDYRLRPFRGDAQGRLLALCLFYGACMTEWKDFLLDEKFIIRTIRSATKMLGEPFGDRACEFMKENSKTMLEKDRTEEASHDLIASITGWVWAPERSKDDLELKRAHDLLTEICGQSVDATNSVSFYAARALPSLPNGNEERCIMALPRDFLLERLGAYQTDDERVRVIIGKIFNKYLLKDAEEDRASALLLRDFMVDEVATISRPAQVDVARRLAANFTRKTNYPDLVDEACVQLGTGARPKTMIWHLFMILKHSRAQERAMPVLRQITGQAPEKILKYIEKSSFTDTFDREPYFAELRILAANSSKALESTFAGGVGGGQRDREMSFRRQPGGLGEVRSRFPEMPVSKGTQMFNPKGGVRTGPLRIA
ncbi:Uncharacterised protein [Candidatus Burarchaeum australiense]|nr:Uncharacterised protein [Candidatus Burarchaeum australiense]